MDTALFSKIVSEDIKKRSTPQQRSLLRSADYCVKWRDELLRIKEDATTQIASLDAVLESKIERYPDNPEIVAVAQAEHSDKVGKIQRFLFYVEKTLEEAEEVVEGTDPHGEAPPVDEFLVAAIKAHREHTEQKGIDPEEHDEALWRALDGVWAFGQS